MTTRIQCSATTHAGTRCPNRVMPGKTQCFTHDPDTIERRRYGSREGGKGKSNERRAYKKIPSDIRSTLTVLFDTLEGVRNGSIAPAQAQAIASLSRAIVSAWEAGSVEAKLRELEAKFEGRDGK